MRLAAKGASAPERSHEELEINLGVGLGNVVAAILSWSANHSVLWCILHGLFSWFYVVYYLVTR